MVGGVPRYGTAVDSSRGWAGEDLEGVRVGGRERVLNLRQTTADPVVGTITLAEAGRRLTAR